MKLLHLNSSPVCSYKVSRERGKEPAGINSNLGAGMSITPTSSLFLMLFPFPQARKEQVCAAGRGAPDGACRHN